MKSSPTDGPAPRTTLFGAAWALYLLALVTGGAGAVLARALAWSRDFPAGVPPARFAGYALFVLALFSNVVFVVAAWMRKAAIPRAWKLLLAGALAVDAALPLLLPEFARMPWYWPWLAAIACLAWAYAFTPPPVGARPADDTGTTAGVPDLLWAWLGFTVFWLGVTTVNYAEYRAALRSAKPARAPAAIGDYVHDEANALTAAEGDRVRAMLAGFERETSSQVAVATYPGAPPEPLEEFTLRTAELSRLGRKGLDNGAVLFVFPAARVARLEVGYGLEGALPDALAHRVLDERLVPALARGEAGAGVEAALSDLLAAAHDEYRAGAQRGPVAQAWRQVRALAPRVAKELWPFLKGVPLSGRIGISFFGTFIGFGVASGVANAFRLVRAAARGALNLSRRRPVRTGIDTVQFAPVIDTAKLLVLAVAILGCAAAVVAGGGAYGGAGAVARW